MTSDKQLKGIKLQDVRMKRDADQALNMKEFAVLAGVSYSVAREWFHAPGFPALLGKVFWADFVLWRRSQNQRKSPHNFDARETAKLGKSSSGQLLPSLPINGPLVPPTSSLTFIESAAACCVTERLIRAARITLKST